MAYITGFDFDVFISYAHVNNQRAAEGEDGWVTQFQKRFEVQLSTLVGRMGLVKIWWDPAIDGNQLFDLTIQERVNRSAIFLAMTSKGYLASDYCQQELGWFVQKATEDAWGLNVGDRVRVFNLLLNNIPHSQWPDAYSGTSGHPFHDAEREDQIGYPTDPGEKLFKRQLRALVEAVYSTLEEFRAALAAAPNTAEASRQGRDDKSTNEYEFTVFLADTSDALRTVRRRVANELSQQGVRLTVQVPPPFEAGAHDDKVIAEIERADLSVHLIDAWPGREIEQRPERTYPQHQVELALAHAGAQLIWAPQSLDLQSVEDETHRRFLDQLENGPREGAAYSFIRESPSALTREILVRLDQLKRVARSPQEMSAVLLATHLKDQLHALDLSRYFLEHDVQPYINPETDNPTRNVKVLEERLKQVSRLIIVFGDVAEEWVRARLGEAVKIAITEECPLKACGIYFAPPRQKAAGVNFDLGFLPVYQFDSRDIGDPQILLQLLGEAKGG